jgi:hypothetical protein
MVSPLFLSKNRFQQDLFYYDLGKLKLKLLPVSFNINPKIITEIGKNEISIVDIENAYNHGLIEEDQTISINNLYQLSFYKNRSSKWKEEQGFIPQVKEMLLVNPRNFHKDILGKIYDIYGTRQISKLKSYDIKKITYLIDLLGVNILSLKNEYVKDFNPFYISIKYNNSDVQDYRIELNKILKENDLDLNQIVKIIKALKNYPKLKKYIRKLNTVTKKEIDLIMYISNLIDTSVNIDFNDFEVIYFKILLRYRINGANTIYTLLDIFNKNKYNKTTIPLISGNINKYSYEVLPKSSPDGLILGYATDCCQVVKDSGFDCLLKGYEEENSSFFVVKKQGKIYAQSWIWEAETDLGRTLCFDSIEVLGKDFTKSKDVLAAYLEATDMFLENGFDAVICGADGNAIPKGMGNIGYKIDQNNLEDSHIRVPFNNCYTDIEEKGIIVIKEKNE